MGSRLNCRPVRPDASPPRSDIAAVSPVGVIRPAIDSSVPFIGATRAWRRLGLDGKGVKIAVVDTGIDYTHAAFGGAGTRDEYDANDPTIVEQGSFPTERVIGGYDFVGENYDVDDSSGANDTPEPDPDPARLRWDTGAMSPGSAVAAAFRTGSAKASPQRPGCSPTRCGPTTPPPQTCWWLLSNERWTPTGTATSAIAPTSSPSRGP